MTLTTDELRQIVETDHVQCGDAAAMARELLANREAQPVGFDELADAVKEVTGGIRMKFAHDTYKGHQPVPFMNFTSLSRIVEMFRTTPPAPAVPDDTRRMDWLVAHHVTVRKPLRYGSEAMFTAQTITDEEDDYHATKLREQIDAAMLAAAPEGGNG